jgi:outer membrane protein assembly factor BamB
MRNILALILILSAAGLCAQDWPDWRGENRDGTWNETGIINKFENNPVPLKWSVPVGPGYSGPSVSAGRVYLTDKQAGQERVLCFDAESGKILWSFSYDCNYEKVGYPGGPRASVVISENKAYSLGTMGHLYCFDAVSGAVLWSRNLNSDYKIRMPIWGIAATPLIIRDKIILQIAGSDNACIIALDKSTGKELWKSMNDGASYSAPILIKQAGKKVIVVWTAENLAGLDPESGTVYWEIPFQVKMAMAISTPVFYGDYIFVSCFYSGALLIKLDDKELKAVKVWQRVGESERKTDALHCVINTPVIIDDYIYGVDSYGELRCLDLKTGDRIWEDLSAVTKNRWANIHLIQHGKQTWMFNEHGELLITELSPAGLKVISRAKLIEPTTLQLNRSGIGVTWSHPAFANRHIFIRNDKELVCAWLGK